MDKRKVLGPKFPMKMSPSAIESYGKASDF